MHGFKQDLVLEKRRATKLKPEKIQINELSYQPVKLHTEALLEFLSKAIAEEINAVLKNECMACNEPARQVHCCYRNNTREKVDHNFDNAFQLVDLWLASETAFEKTKDKKTIKSSQRQKYLLNGFRIIEKCIFHGSLKYCCNEIIFVNTYVFFL